MRRVLVIDDQADVAEVVLEAVKAAMPEVACEAVTDFAAADNSIIKQRPDAIVLDLIDNAHEESRPGERTWQSVWDGVFCPVVIYTAWEGDLNPPVPQGHPFVKRVAKGGGTEAQVVEHLKSFVPAIQALDSLHAEVGHVIQRVLRETAGSGAISADDPTTLLHAGRRRLAAAMDDPTATTAKPLQSWEQYLVPAIGESPLTGDVLRKHGAEIDNVTAYRLVLSPSCDLERSRNPETILVAGCEDLGLLLKATESSTRENKRKEAVKNLQVRALSRGFIEGRIPLPAFPGHVPHMVANLKRLEVLSFSSLYPAAGGAPEFDRVASIDSPFREQIAWAFMSSVARPGMPDRDLQAWATACLEQAAKEQSAGGEGSPEQGS